MARMDSQINHGAKAIEGQLCQTIVERLWQSGSDDGTLHCWEADICTEGNRFTWSAWVLWVKPSCFA